MPGKRTGPHRKEADGLAERVRDRGPDQDVVRRACARFWDRDVEAMAKAVGRSRSAVHHWITGRAAVDGEDLMLIAAAARTTVDDLRGVSPNAISFHLDPGAAAALRADPERMRGLERAALDAANAALADEIAKAEREAERKHGGGAAQRDQTGKEKGTPTRGKR